MCSSTSCVWILGSSIISFLNPGFPAYDNRIKLYRIKLSITIKAKLNFCRATESSTSFTAVSPVLTVLYLSDSMNSFLPTNLIHSGRKCQLWNVTLIVLHRFLHAKLTIFVITEICQMVCSQSCLCCGRYSSVGFPRGTFLNILSTVLFLGKHC